MKYNDIEVKELAICFLCGLKNKFLETKNGEIKTDTGYLACAHYIDTIIETLMRLQSRVANLESSLEIEKQYASAWGDFFGYTPQELSKDEQEALKKHMKIFEEQWKKKEEEEE